MEMEENMGRAYDVAPFAGTVVPASPEAVVLTGIFLLVVTIFVLFLTRAQPPRQWPPDNAKK